VIFVKRYFDIPDKKQVIELDIKDGSQAVTAPAEVFSKAYKMNMREVNKSEYQKLAKEYAK
jgi:hypothetical protein